MPALAIWIGAALRTAWVWIVVQAARWVPTIVGQVLVALGLKFAVLDPGANLILSHVIARFDLVQGSSLETLYYLNVDDFVNLIISANVARAAGRAFLFKRSVAAGA